MNNTKKSLIGFVSLIFIICILSQTVLAQENETKNISPLQGITATPQNTTFSESPQRSGVTQEDILIEAQRNFDRSLSILNMVATLMGVLVTILAVIIAIAGGLGFLEIKRWQENRKKIEDDAEATKKIVDFIKELRAKAENDVNVLRHDIESFPRPSLTEEPSSEVREKLAEFSHRLETLEILGASLRPEDYITRGDDFYYKGKYDEALKAYEKTIELKPDYARTWNSKGIVLTRLGRYDEAHKASKKAMELEPNNVLVRYKLARFYSIEENKEKLLSNLKKAIEMKLIYKKYAKKEKDFEKFWNDEDFKKLVG